MAIDRTDAAKVLVAGGDALLGFFRDAKPAKHVIEKRHDVVGTLGAAKGDDEHGVVVVRLEVVKPGVELFSHRLVCSAR